VEEKLSHELHTLQALTNRIECRSCQKIRTDHLQAVSTGAISSQRERRRFDRLVDHWDLALIQLEVDNFPRLGFLARQFPFHRHSQLVRRELPGFVQSDCTIEVLPLLASPFCELVPFVPAP
jgi:hypothetical protein